MAGDDGRLDSEPALDKKCSSDTSVQLLGLLNRVTRGEEPGYDEVIARALQRLWSLTHRMLDRYSRLRRWEQTDDILQQVLMRLHQSLTQVKPESVREFFGLAATQVRRTLIDLCRHYFGVEGEGANHHSDQPSPASGREAGHLQRHAAEGCEPESLEAWTLFHNLAEELPEQERQVFEMIWYGGLEQQEVARILDISVTTVKRRWRSARKLISERIRQDDLLD